MALLNSDKQNQRSQRIGQAFVNAELNTMLVCSRNNTLDTNKHPSDHSDAVEGQKWRARAMVNRTMAPGSSPCPRLHRGISAADFPTHLKSSCQQDHLTADPCNQTRNPTLPIEKASAGRYDIFKGRNLTAV